MIRIKVCGVTTPADAAAVSAAGADAIGLNFTPGTPRFLTADRTYALLRQISAFVTPVGVFGLRSPMGMILDCEDYNLRVVQTYHPRAFFTAFRTTLQFPCFRIRDEKDMDFAHRVLAKMNAKYVPPQAIVIDSHVPGALGGTGHTAPWHLLADFDPGVPVILAGGLTPDNVAEAIRIVRPYGVDVCSGVESSPGVKDLHKVKDFIAAAREAFSAL